MMPNGWQDTVFGDIAYRAVNVADPGSVVAITPYIALENISQQALHLNSVGRADQAVSGKIRFESGDVLFGKLRPYFRKVVHSKFSGVCSTDIWVLRPRKGVDRSFLFYTAASQQFVDHATRGSTGTKMPRADWRHVSKLPIQLPPLHEQQEIGRILRALDDKIELNRRMNATLEAMARALFQSWFVDFDPVHAKAEGRQPVGMDAETAALFPDSFEDSALGPIPKGWTVMTLGDVCDFEYGKPLKAEDRKGGDIPVFGAGGQVGWHNEALSTGPGIVVGRKGNPGAVTWSRSDFFAIDTAYFVKSKHLALSPYILFQILSNLDLSRLSVDSGVPGLNRHHAYMSLLVVAATPILQAFNAHAQMLGAEISSNGNSSRSLVGMRDLLIPKLLSGELRIGDVAA
jgi:type I restriction enzyme S subunit